jgi:hypothetical protein
VDRSNTPLSIIDISSRPEKKINKETSELNCTIHQMNLTDIYRIFYPTAEKCTLFLAAHGNFSKISHILGHKASLCKYKKTEIISCFLSNHKRIKLDITQTYPD